MPEENKVAKSTFRIDPALLQRIQDRVRLRFGKLKGGQNEAITQAWKLWLAFTGEDRVIIYTNPAAGGTDFVLSDNIEPLLRQILQGKTDLELMATVVSIGGQTFPEGVISQVIEALTGRYGRPPFVKLEGGGETPTELMSEVHTSWEEKLQERQEQSEVPIEIVMAWPELDLRATLGLEMISIHPYLNKEDVTATDLA